MHRFNFSAKTSNKHIVLNCKYQLCLEKETSFQIVRITSKTTKAANRFISLFKFDLNCYCFVQSIFLSDSLARALTRSPIHFLALSFTFSLCYSFHLSVSHSFLWFRPLFARNGECTWEKLVLQWWTDLIALKISVSVTFLSDVFVRDDFQQESHSIPFWEFNFQLKCLLIASS